jgi:hypothetical protein
MVPVPAAAPRPPPLIAADTFTRAVWAAGARPKRKPVASDTPVANTTTDESSAIGPAPGAPAPASEASNGTLQTANAIPTTPPASASTTHSTNNCDATRARLAPIAARIAISFWRPTARASRRFATFAHAISSTNPTAAASTSTDCLMFWTA